MKNLGHALLKLVLPLVLSGSAYAGPLPFLHPLFTNDMVLQRDALAPVWGWTTPNSAVTVTINGQTKSATADGNGRWQVSVGPFAAGGPYTLSVSGLSSATLNNVMMGDVFLCSGQSNMVWPVNNCYNANDEAIDSANYPNIRCFSVPDQLSATEEQTITVPANHSWKVAGVNTTKAFTATGYFMARELSKQMPNVPIGIVASAWGGTPIESWIDRTSVAGIVDFRKSLFDGPVQPLASSSASQIYNAKIAPLAPMRFKGAIWYQGESNAGRGEQYERLLPLMKNRWRSIFGQANLPFIIVQISTDTATLTNQVENTGWGEVREAQTKSVVADPYSALVTTLDIGEGDLHPKNKQDVGKRASKAALKLIYGENLVHQGPIFTSASVSGSTIVCNFSNTGGGLMVGTKNAQTPLSPVQEVVGGALKGFSIAGADKVFKVANATISGNTVVVSSAEVSSPLWVRYAWAKNPECNLYAKITNGSGNVVDGLPAGSFRNDPTYRLSVNSGTGSGYSSYNGTINITAATLAGQTFNGWIGDTSFLVNPASATTTATLGQNYVSVKASYNITSVLSGLAAIPKPGGIQLSWNPMDQVHYKIWRSLQSSGPFTVIKELPESGGYTDTDVVEGTTYYYRVTVFNDTHTGGLTTSIVSGQSAPKKNYLLDRSGWTATASSNLGYCAYALDGNMATRWTTGAQQVNGQWYQFDMGSPQLISQIDLEGFGDYPRGYEVKVSLDGTTWSSSVATGVGTSNVTSIMLSTAVKARYVKITQTGSVPGLFWSIYELNVYGLPAQDLDRASWVYSASVSGGSNLASNAGDNNLATRWSSAGPQANGQWFMVDMGSPRLISELTLDAATSGNDYPRGYSVHVSNDGVNWGSALASGIGKTAVTSIQLPLTIARYVRVTQTGSTTGNYWSIHEFKAAGAMLQGLPRAGWTATASPTGAGQPVTSAFDGNISTRWSTGAVQASGQWFQLDLGSIKTFRHIVMDAAGSGNDYPRGYQLSVSQDGTNWGSPITSGVGYSANTVIAVPKQNARYIRIQQTGTATGNYWSIHELNVYDFPVSAPSTPSGVIAAAGNEQISLSWSGDVNVASYTVKRATSAAGPFTVLASNVVGASYIDQTVIAGIAYYYVISGVNNAGEGSNSAQSFATVSGVSVLPSPWNTQNIGTTNGGAKYLDSNYYLAGAGSDIWGYSDQFSYASQSVSGDCSVVARVLNLDNTSPWAKAGVMIRETTAGGSVHVAAFATPGAGISFQWRSTTGGACSFTSISGTAPRWVKLTRAGNVFSAFYSSDGQTWTALGMPQTITMGSAITAGLAITSHDAAKICNASLDNVIVTP